MRSGSISATVWTEDDPMDDVVMVACGGGAFRIVDCAGSRITIPKVIINSNENSVIPLVPEGVRGCFGDTHLAETLLEDNIGSLSDFFKGRRIAIIFTVLGGGTGNGMMPTIIQCARSSGCSVVSLVGIPMSFEKDRRDRALELLPGLVELSDRMFVMDLEILNRLFPRIKFRNGLEVHARTVAFALENMYRLMNGPFFSTFSQRIYTFAYASDLDPLTAVTKAMESPMVETDPSEGKLILFVSSGFGTAEEESIIQDVVSISGILPEIIRREDLEDTKLLMILSVKDSGH